MKHYKHSKHKVELFDWVENIFKKTEHFFDQLEVALQFAFDSITHDAKVYNRDGEMIHSRRNDGGDTYA
jgi:hypothetical protein